jgi:hypothetical protein
MRSDVDLVQRQERREEAVADGHGRGVAPGEHLEDVDRRRIGVARAGRGLDEEVRPVERTSASQLRHRQPDALLGRVRGVMADEHPHRRRDRLQAGHLADVVGRRHRADEARALASELGQAHRGSGAGRDRRAGRRHREAGIELPALGRQLLEHAPRCHAAGHGHRDHGACPDDDRGDGGDRPPPAARHGPQGRGGEADVEAGSLAGDATEDEREGRADLRGPGHEGLAARGDGDHAAHRGTGDDADRERLHD